MSEEKQARQHHHEQLVEWGEQAQRVYEKAHADARADPQRSGHIGEETWAAFLREWLPERYEVRTRRYIIPEVGDDNFETDIVVLRPSYPRALRDSVDVLASGVAAAFSVKLTLLPEGIRDAAARSVRLRRSMRPREGSPRTELHGEYPFGLLALSHTWKPGDQTAFKSNLLSLQETTEHPRDLLDFICVPDLGCATAARVPYLPVQAMEVMSGGKTRTHATAASYGLSDPEKSISPVASFISGLLTRLSFHDPELRVLAQGLRADGTQGNAEGMMRYWAPEQVYSEETLTKLPTHWFSSDEWSGEYH